MAKVFSSKGQIGTGDSALLMKYMSVMGRCAHVYFWTAQYTKKGFPWAWNWQLNEMQSLVLDMTVGNSGYRPLQ